MSSSHRSRPRSPGTLCLAATAALALSSSPTALAKPDGKNYGGMLCKVDGTSPAPPSEAYFDFFGRVCNASGAEPLNVICPLTQDEMTENPFTVYFDYIMWNANGVNGRSREHPRDTFECQAFSRTAHGEGYYYSGWKNVDDYPDNFGDTPHFIVGTVNLKMPDGFIGARCQIPRTYGGQMSCLSHLCVDEAI